MNYSDDCHHYIMDCKPGGSHHLIFYRLNEDGSERTGVTNEEVIRVLLHRLKFLNGVMSCRENSIAITKLEEALMWLEKRAADRVARKVEGTHER